MKNNRFTEFILPFCLIALFCIAIARQPAFSIERDKYLYFNDIDGLPRNIVTSIEQDKYGYTWIGTGNGISRFNGNEFKNYDQLKGQLIRSLLINKDGLWVASDEGLYYYNRTSDHFEIKFEGYVNAIGTYLGEIYFAYSNKIMKLNLPENMVIIQDKYISEFCITNEGFWFDNDGDGVNFVSHSNRNVIKTTLLHKKAISIIREIEGNLFFGCTNGELFVLKPDGTELQVAIENHHACKEVIKVNNEIWLATDGNGILILDENLNYKRSLNRGYHQNLKFKSNSIYDVYLGHDNEVWIATYGAGLISLMEDTSPFKNIIPEPGNRNSLVAKEGVSAFKKENKIYLGTNYGLSVLDENTGDFTNLSLKRLKQEMEGSKVLAINTDQQNNFWLGTYDGLLGKYTPDLKFIRSYHPCGDNATDMQRIIFIHKCIKNNLLIVTHYRDKSLLNFDLETEKFTPLSLFVNGTNQKNLFITSLRENRDGETMALLRTKGLYTVNLEKNILENNLPEVNNRITFRLSDYYKDTKGYYWLATQKEGLVRMSEDGKEFDKWTTEQGLPTNSLLRIESTDDKYLWISTISGLCRFEMETGSMLIFNHEHGLPADEFIARASTLTNDGRLIFGSVAGFTIVDPKKVQPDTSDTKVIISDIMFQNQSIKHITDKPILTSPIEETTEIHLPFKRNSFTIHFFSKDKGLPKYNNYAYRLVGLEENWIYLGETKHTTYTNLSPGKYTFEVKSTNKSNVWNNTPTQLVIQINPPWYLSWYAILFYAVFIVLTILGAMYFYAYRVRLKKEVEISEFKFKTEHELTEKKLAFFTNVSHDFKTPLTLINAPLGDLIHDKNLNDEQRNKLQIIYKNSSRLHRLISDLLDFRKLTQRQLPLKVRKTDGKKLIENTCAAFHDEFRTKEINFVSNINVSDDIFVDSRKIEKILWNLLSNAIKFNTKDGEIYLNAKLVNINKKQHLQILVKDTGIGIAEENQKRIFNRFYQVHDGKKNAKKGAGIGLSIVKDMVEIHHGNIEFTSDLGMGTTFIVTIPSKEEYYSGQEIDKSTKEEEVPFSKEQFIKLSEEEIEKQTRYNLPKILLAEDNTELLNYLANHFEKNFKVYKASDGEKGLQIAKEKNPDIIITDILMPKMNGYEFCRKIKQHFETSHIPVIMLTANSTMEQQIEGLEMGADAYIPKPFNIKILDATILSVLETRKKIRERIMGVTEDEGNDSKLSPKDIKFIEELKLCIETNIGNYKLNVELLSEHFAISKTHLNRKIKSLTGRTPNNLIKSLRLKMAYELIHTKGLRVSEAAFETGFSDPNYFTTCFKKEFGKNPSQIIKV